MSNDNFNTSKSPKENKASLFIVFKYVAIGSGILGIGFLIALIGLLLSY